MVLVGGRDVMDLASRMGVLACCCWCDWWFCVQMFGKEVWDAFLHVSNLYKLCIYYFIVVNYIP